MLQVVAIHQEKLMTTLCFGTTFLTKGFKMSLDKDGFTSRSITRNLAKQRKAARDAINPPDRYVLIEISKGNWISKKVSSLYDLI